MILPRLVEELDYVTPALEERQWIKVNPNSTVKVRRKERRKKRRKKRDAEPRKPLLSSQVSRCVCACRLTHAPDVAIESDVVETELAGIDLA